MTITIELVFKNEYLIRMCFAATKLVTSLEFNPNRCATMQCLFGQKRNGSVAIHFSLRGTHPLVSSKGQSMTFPISFKGVFFVFGVNESVFTVSGFFLYLTKAKNGN